MAGHWHKFLAAMCVLAWLSGCSSTHTPTPPFQRWRADDVWHALTAAGLPVADYRDDTTTALEPRSKTEAKAFAIKGTAGGGLIQTFHTPEDLAVVQRYWGGFPELASYVLVRGNVLVRLNAQVPEGDVARYRAALDALR